MVKGKLFFFQIKRRTYFSNRLACRIFLSLLSLIVFLNKNVPCTSHHFITKSYFFFILRFLLKVDWQFVVVRQNNYHVLKHQYCLISRSPSTYPVSRLWLLKKIMIIKVCIAPPPHKHTHIYIYISLVFPHIKQKKGTNS